MRIAYADPPYPGQGKRYSHKKEVNHRLLIAHLQEYDGWALSTGSSNLYEVLPLCPPKTRIGAWVKTWGGLMPNVDPAYRWEPVLFSPSRRGRIYSVEMTAFDWVSANTVMANEGRKILGQKPDKFSFWLFRILRALPSDEFVDLFPGSGAVSQAWKAWCSQTYLPMQGCSYSITGLEF